MKAKRSGIGIVLSALLTTVIFSACSLGNITQTGTENTGLSNGEKKLNELRTLPFIGGSVIYNPDNAALNHLSQGQLLPIRLGEVIKTYDPTNDDYQFSNDEAKARYGFIVIREISLEKVSFSYKLYDTNGMTIASGVSEVASNQQTDINGDGAADIAYTKPAQVRTGFENALYLTFISSQDTLKTAMFSLLAEDLPGSAYPSGIMGVNPDGKMVVRNDAMTVQQGAAGAGSRVLGTRGLNALVVEAGDFVMDREVGKYGKVSSVSKVLGRSISAQVDYSEQVSIADALPHVHFNYTVSNEVPMPGYEPAGGVTETLDPYATQANSPSRASSFDNFANEAKAIGSLIGKYRSFDLINKTAWKIKTDNTEVSFATLKVTVGVDASCDVSWNYVAATIKTGLFYHSDLTLSASGKWTKNLFDQQLVSYRADFAIGPVLLGLEVPLSVGADIDMVASGNIKYQYESKGFVGYNVSFGAKLTRKHWYSLPSIKTWCDNGFINQHTYRFIGEPEITGSASVALRPYVSAGLKVKLWEIFYGKGIVKLFFGGKIQADLNNDILTLKAICEMGIKLDGEAGLDAYVFDKKWKFDNLLVKTWELGSSVLFQRNLVYWPATAVNTGTPAPYPNNFNQTYSFSQPGAKKIKLHFDIFRTEKNFDYVYFYDKSGNQIGQANGSCEYSPVVYGDTIRMKLVSDNSVNTIDNKPGQVHVDKVLYQEF